MLQKVGNVRLGYTIINRNSPLSVSEVVGRVRKIGKAGRPSECSPRTPRLRPGSAAPFPTYLISYQIQGFCAL